jgi:hypothetical protein
MKTIKLSLGYIVLLVVLCAAGKKKIKTPVYEVKSYGSELNTYDPQPKLAAGLDSFINKENLYAIGVPLDKSGECLILKGQSIKCYINKDASKPLIKEEYVSKMAMLVYGKFERFNEITIPPQITNLALLESFIEKSTDYVPEDPDSAFAFLLKIKVETLNYHIHQSKDLGLYRGQLKNQDIVILGFFCAKGKKSFLPNGQKMVLNFITKDRSLIGRVDDLIITSGKLAMPN